MASENDEPKYFVPPAVSPLVEELMEQADAQQAEFLAKQQQAQADAHSAAARMGEGGTPEEKRPV